MEKTDEHLKIVLYAYKYCLGKKGNETAIICEKLIENIKFFNQNQLVSLTEYLESVVLRIKNKHDREKVFETINEIKKHKCTTSLSLQDCYAFDREAIMYWLVCPNTDINELTYFLPRIKFMNTKDKIIFKKDLADFKIIAETIPFLKIYTINRLKKLKRALII